MERMALREVDDDDATMDAVRNVLRFNNDADVSHENERTFVNRNTEEQLET